MKPKPDPLKDQFQLFQASFDQLLNPQHPLVLLADKIDWLRFDEELLPCYAEKGRPGIPIRLMAGLCYLKYTHLQHQRRRHAASVGRKSLLAILLRL